MFLLSSTPILRIGRMPKLIISIIMDVIGLILGSFTVGTFLLTLFTGGAAVVSFIPSALGLLAYWAIYCFVGLLLYGAPFAVVGFLKPLVIGSSALTVAPLAPFIALIPLMTIWWFLSNR